MEIHVCKYEELMGGIKEFMGSVKGFRVVLFSMGTAILLQVGTFLFLWGGLTVTVKQNTEQIWNVLNPSMLENTRNIDKILGKIELMSSKNFNERP